MPATDARADAGNMAGELPPASKQNGWDKGIAADERSHFHGRRLPSEDGRWLYPLLALIALAAIAIPLAVICWAPPPPRTATIAATSKRVVPPTALPIIEPVEFRDLSPQDARAANAEVPFVPGGVDPARPYRMRGEPDAVARAIDCLAAALLYEAGDDAVGERAVAQVVLNRLRHPAFPKTVCGVVFQGSERATGCQFTFTCDGALRRVPGEASWRRARRIAARALAGFVYRPVGLATHYHTDWVVPYWSSSLDKIAAVKAHLFFRWTGWWGTPAAFQRTPLAVEPPEAQLAFLSEAHRLAGTPADPDGLMAETRFLDQAATPLPRNPDTFFVRLDARQWKRYAEIAQRSCGERVRCNFKGWTDVTAIPATAPMTPRQNDAMSFDYLRDQRFNFERWLWNCREFPRAPRNCMASAIDRALSPQVAATPTIDPVAARPLRASSANPPVDPAHRPSRSDDVRKKRSPGPVASLKSGGSGLDE